MLSIYTGGFQKTPKNKSYAYDEVPLKKKPHKIKRSSKPPKTFCEPYGKQQQDDLYEGWDG